MVGVAPGVPERLGLGASACDAATIGATSVSAPICLLFGVVGTRTRASSVGMGVVTSGVYSTDLYDFPKDAPEG